MRLSCWADAGLGRVFLSGAIDGEQTGNSRISDNHEDRCEGSTHRPKAVPQGRPWVGNKCGARFGSPKTRASWLEVPLAPTVLRELKEPTHGQGITPRVLWFLLLTKACRSRRIISEKRHSEPRARELLCSESIGIPSVRSTGRCCIRGELL